MADYRLRCLFPGCDRSYETDTSFRLQCDAEAEGRHGPALLRAEYDNRRLEVRALPGVFAYADWLPTGSYYLDAHNADMGRPACYRSQGLAKRLGLSRLFVAFSGYWPERGANLQTRSFKEFEAQVTLARYLGTRRDSGCAPFVISSAGNTANGFNLLTHALDLPLYLVVPATGLDNLVLPFPTSPFTVVVRGDYADAIQLADRVGKACGLMREGGARNVARRAGLGAELLHAVAHPVEGSGHLFDHYVQAVGSGTGAIGAWEAAELLRRDGRFGEARTRIHIAQNAPFTPMVDAWEARQRALAPVSDEAAADRIAAVTASVLTNRQPPYGIAGGMYDVLTASGGRAWRVDNAHVFQGARMFRETEGVDIGPAAAVAVDALRQAVERGAIGRDDSVLLHITGGGREIQHAEGEVFTVNPTVIVEPGDLDTVVKAIKTPAAIQRPFPGLKTYM
jgi:cysteate synthase